jgi:hypothetical protein
VHTIILVCKNSFTVEEERRRKDADTSSVGENVEGNKK